MKNKNTHLKLGLLRSSFLAILLLVAASGFGGTVTVQFKTSAGVGISGVVPQYFLSGAWTNFTGSTDGTGSVSQTFTTGSLPFRINYAAGTLSLGTINVATTQTVNAFTTLVTVNLKHYDGSLNTTESGVAEYYNGGWITIGSTSGGSVSKELLPGSYPFHMIYHNSTEQVSVTIAGGSSSGNTQSIDFQTTKVTTSLKNHTGSAGISGSLSQYYTTTWYNIGITDASGDTVIELLPGSYYFNMNYNHFTYQTLSTTISAGAPGTSWTQTIPFQTTLVTTSLVNHSGTPISGAPAQYYSGTYYSIGSTNSSGDTAVELLPGSYYFTMTYNHAIQQLGPLTVGSGPYDTIPFQTMLVSENIKDCNGALISTSAGTAQYYSGGWWSFGTTSGGTVSKELLPGSYYFNMNYNGVLIQQGPITYSSGLTQNVDFSTTNVNFPTASTASFSIPSPVSYMTISAPSAGVALFPGTYLFKTNAATAGRRGN